MVAGLVKNVSYGFVDADKRAQVNSQQATSVAQRRSIAAGRCPIVHIGAPAYLETLAGILRVQTPERCLWMKVVLLETYLGGTPDGRW